MLFFFLNACHDDSLRLKILSFLSFHTDPMMKKGMSLHIITPHPAIGDPLQASTSPDSEPGKHHSTPQTLRKCPQIDDVTLQCMNRWHVKSLSPPQRQHISDIDSIINPFLKLFTVEILLATANK